VDSSAKAKRDGFRKGAISTTAKNHRRNTLRSCVSSNVGSTEWKAHLKNGILVSGSAVFVELGAHRHLRYRREVSVQFAICFRMIFRNALAIRVLSRNGKNRDFDKCHA